MPAEAKKVTPVRLPKIGETLAHAVPALCGALLLAPEIAGAQSLTVPGLDLRIDAGAARPAEVATALKILAVLTVLSLAPAILMVMTAFTRIIVVLALLRLAIGTQETPPNSVLVSLALFLTLFTMQPVLSQIDSKAFQPYLNGSVGFERAAEIALQPMREFMIRQTREQDLMLMLDVSKTEPPEDVDQVRTVHLIPAFMLSELKTAFQIGFVVFLPFLLLDIVVSSILMSMGMLMVPPMMISLPLKLLLFVLIDGWNLVVKALLGSFH
jgi:flagellar biosynthetic protein FliP